MHGFYYMSKNNSPVDLKFCKKQWYIPLPHQGLGSQPVIVYKICTMNFPLILMVHVALISQLFGIPYSALA